MFLNNSKQPSRLLPARTYCVVTWSQKLNIAFTLRRAGFEVYLGPAYQPLLGQIFHVWMVPLREEVLQTAIHAGVDSHIQSVI